MSYTPIRSHSPTQFSEAQHFNSIAIGSQWPRLVASVELLASCTHTEAVTIVLEHIETRYSVGPSPVVVAATTASARDEYRRGY